MNHGSSAQFLKLPELRSRLSVMPSVREIVDALYQGKRYLPPILMNGQALRLHISFRWPMKVIGMTTITAAGSQFCRKQEELSILCKMGCCLESGVHQLFDSYALSINPDVRIPNPTFSEKVADDYLRIITRLCSSLPIRKVSPASILIKGFLMIPNDLSEGCG
jgi:hypothetical protein